jgi:hypothetical protein
MNETVRKPAAESAGPVERGELTSVFWKRYGHDRIAGGGC